MKKLTIIILAICSVGSTLAQNLTPDKDKVIAQQINEQLWKPFKKAWEARDAKAYNALHTDDVLRVSKWGIRQGKEFREGNKASFAKENQPHRTINFWLEHRIFSSDLAYEVGYYKIISKREGLEPRVSYARFHVVLKKVNGQWKIAQDWDTSSVNGHKITEEDYNKGTPLNL